MSRGSAIASSTAFFVMALKTTRFTGFPLMTFLLLRRSSTCQEIASPSRSGSVARMRPSEDFIASAISLMRLDEAASTSQNISKSWSGRTEPSFAGRSRTWPKDASTLYPGPRYLLIVLAFAGDSTTTTFIIKSLNTESCPRRMGCTKNRTVFSGLRHGGGIRRGQEADCIFAEQNAIQHQRASISNTILGIRM
jgi:hypothetical protein